MAGDEAVSLFDFLLFPCNVNEIEHGEDRIFSGKWFPAALLPAEADCQLVPNAAEIETWHPGDDAVARKRRLSLFAAAACFEVKRFRAAQAYMSAVTGPTTTAFIHLMRSPSKEFHRRAQAHVEKALVLLAELEGGESATDLSRRWERAYQPVAISGMVGVWGADLEKKCADRAAEAGYGGDEAWRGLEEAQAAALHELARLAERYRGEPDDPSVATLAGTAAETSHSEDFTSVNWLGTRHTFSRLQAACVRVMWEAWEQDGHALNQETIGEKSGSSATPFRLAHVFRKGSGGYHAAWKTMIHRLGKGSFGLRAPHTKNTENAQ
jgi:hypothetical protein